MDIPPSLEDIPDWAISELKGAQVAHTLGLFNVALQVLALAQQKLQIRNMRFELQVNGDVVVSVVGDAQGKNALPYARIRLRDPKLNLLGEVNPPDDSHPAGGQL